MKRIFLVRHAEPVRMEHKPNPEWPLSCEGREQAEALFRMPQLSAVKCVYASPYRRALETAECTGRKVCVDARLQERLPGAAMPDMGDCWLRQYEEQDFKCPGGESFAEVGQRMAACISDVLAALEEESSALVVSHGAAICAFLIRHGNIRVTDRASKTREITWQNRLIYAGCLPYLSGCCLTYQQDKLESIEAMHTEGRTHHGA